MKLKDRKPYMLGTAINERAVLEHRELIERETTR